jgi:hypothetical protein
LAHAFEKGKRQLPARCDIKMADSDDKSTLLPVVVDYIKRKCKEFVPMLNKSPKVMVGLIFWGFYLRLKV